MKVKTKPIIYDAYQWHRNGDHPDDNCEVYINDKTGKPFQGEGKVVRYYRNPGVPGEAYCRYCNYPYHAHGWIDSGDHGHDVCPGDWIVTVRPEEPRDKYEVVSAKAFHDLYEAIPEECNDSECNCVRCGGIDMNQMYPPDDSIGLADPCNGEDCCMESCCASIPTWQAPDCDIIEDGFGSAWSAWCPECKRKSMQIVRPGKVQCGYCG